MFAILLVQIDTCCVAGLAPEFLVDHLACTHKKRSRPSFGTAGSKEVHGALRQFLSPWCLDNRPPPTGGKGDGTKGFRSPMDGRHHLVSRIKSHTEVLTSERPDRCGPRAMKFRTSDSPYWTGLGPMAQDCLITTSDHAIASHETPMRESCPVLSEEPKHGLTPHRGIEIQLGR